MYANGVIPTGMEVLLLSIHVHSRCLRLPESILVSIISELNIPKSIARVLSYGTYWKG